MEPVVAEIADVYASVHQKMREVVRDASVDKLNWRPAEGENTIAVLVIHTVGSEKEVLATVAGIANKRDRPAEFKVDHIDAAHLLAALDAADTNLEEVAPKITAADLAAERARGDNAPQTGIRMLMQNAGHAREHLAHLELTRNLYEKRAAE